MTAGPIAVHPERTTDEATLLWRFGAGGPPQGAAWTAAIEHALAPLQASGVVSTTVCRADAVAVTLTPGLPWIAHAAAVRGALQAAAEALAGAPDDPGLRRELLADAARDAVDRVVGPYAAGHGGAVEIVEVTTEVVRLTLSGACHGCPAAALTVHARLEHLIRSRAPWLDHVEVAGLQPSLALARTA
ncbi:NifU family protein [Actinotalea sp. M2MS4P-6]|uniref:NifU family protein n=1 Tax=Actinotalea sp. M2MS4P-6 TaxID=2983762 RepID=UPI0021E4E289|nr:NifU family protein [Actinotalea sp. M2MS4P-6]MCV2393390.1 NifU family protein [Actinotalea sp. M2MS4P-6]